MIVHNIFAYFTLSLSTAQVYMIKERCQFSQIDFVHKYFPHWVYVLFLSSQFDVIHTQIRITLFSRCTNKHSQLETSPNRARIGFSQIAFPITVLPKGDHTDFVQEERLGLPYWTMILAILCRGRRIQMSGHSDFGIFNNLGASSIFTWV